MSLMKVAELYTKVKSQNSSLAKLEKKLQTLESPNFYLCFLNVVDSLEKRLDLLLNCSKERFESKEEYDSRIEEIIDELCTDDKDLDELLDQSDKEGFQVGDTVKVIRNLGVKSGYGADEYRNGGTIDDVPLGAVGKVTSISNFLGNWAEVELEIDGDFEDWAFDLGELELVEEKTGDKKEIPAKRRLPFLPGDVIRRSFDPLTVESITSGDEEETMARNKVGNGYILSEENYNLFEIVEEAKYKIGDFVRVSELLGPEETFLARPSVDAVYDVALGSEGEIVGAYYNEAIPAKASVEVRFRDNGGIHLFEPRELERVIFRKGDKVKVVQILGSLDFLRRYFYREVDNTEVPLGTEGEVMSVYYEMNGNDKIDIEVTIGGRLEEHTFHPRDLTPVGEEYVDKKEGGNKLDKIREQYEVGDTVRIVKALGKRRGFPEKKYYYGGYSDSKSDVPLNSVGEVVDTPTTKQVLVTFANCGMLGDPSWSCHPDELELVKKEVEARVREILSEYGSGREAVVKFVREEENRVTENLGIRFDYQQRRQEIAQDMVKILRQKGYDKLKILNYLREKNIDISDEVVE